MDLDWNPDERQPNSKSALLASTVALASLAVWWVAIRYLDGFFASSFPYDQYSRIALFYPDVYYPGLPGWVIANVQPYSWGVWVVTIGWLVVLSLAIGAASTELTSVSPWSPPPTSLAIVGLLFVATTALEAIALLAA